MVLRDTLIRYMCRYRRSVSRKDGKEERKGKDFWCKEKNDRLKEGEYDGK